MYCRQKCGARVYVIIRRENKMKVYDSVNKTEVEVDGTQGLIDIMVSVRLVDMFL